MADHGAALLDVVIVGAGLCGLAAAISCATAGHRTSIYESTQSLAEIGAGLQITPNASRLLAHWGLSDDLHALASEPTALYVHRYTGQTLAEEKNFDQHIRCKYEAPFVDMHRADLQQMLYKKAISLGVTVQLGAKVSRVDCALSRPTIVLESGEHIAADLVVGADGLWSKCRESLLGMSEKPLPTGDLAYRIVLNIDQIQDAELRARISHPEVHFWIGPYSHAVAYSMRGGAMYNIVLLCPDDLPSGVSHTRGSVEEMKKLFADWDPILTRFLDHVDVVEKWKLMHREEAASWTNSQRNFVLIGDACHPMLPYLAQGANSSLEDGAVLGRILSYVRSPTQLAWAISLYERLRKSRSDMVVRETFLQREDFHLPDGEKQEQRDAVFTSQMGKPISGVFPSRWTCPVVQPWLYGYDGIAVADEAVRKHPFSEHSTTVQTTKVNGSTQTAVTRYKDETPDADHNGTSRGSRCSPISFKSISSWLRARITFLHVQ